MKLRYTLTALLLLINFGLNRAYAENDSTSYRLGLHSGMNLNFHSADFRELPGVGNCCPGFESGFGTGFAFGGFYEAPLDEGFALILRGLYAGYGGILEAKESKLAIVSGVLTETEIKHTIDASLSKILAEPIVSYKAYDNLYILGGFEAGFLIGNSFSQKEELSGPAAGTFENGLRIRNLVSGDIEDAVVFQAALCAGLKYETPLNANNSLFLAPEILFSLSLTPAASFQGDEYWNANSLRLGLNLIYRPIKTAIIEHFQQIQEIDTFTVELADLKEKFIKTGIIRTFLDTSLSDSEMIITETKTRIDTLFTPAATPLQGSVNAVGFDGVNEYPNIRMEVKEIPKINFSPLLTYIFFGHNETAIPDKYERLTPEEANAFSVNKFFNTKTLPTYYQILNIIGYRMRYNPDAEIQVTGCNSGVAEEKNNKRLSKSRAEAVRDYLAEVWKINPSRIKISARNLPEKPSKQDIEEGIAENRRVEIFSDTWEIIQPVITNDVYREIFAPRIKFYPEVNNQALLSEWKLTVLHKGKISKEFFGKDKLPEKIEWRINEEKESIPDSDEPVEYYITLKDTNGRSYSSEVQNISIETITVEDIIGKRINEKKKENFSLILFDFDEKKMDKNNLKILKYIKTRIQDDSKVTIEGYSDITGDDAYNLELSDKRAKETAKILDAKDCIANGYGEVNPLYENNSPEGRFYSRTVVIIVETPID